MKRIPPGKGRRPAIQGRRSKAAHPRPRYALAASAWAASPLPPVRGVLFPDWRHHARASRGSVVWWQEHRRAQVSRGRWGTGRVTFGPQEFADVLEPGRCIARALRRKLARAAWAKAPEMMRPWGRSRLPRWERPRGWSIPPFRPVFQKPPQKPPQRSRFYLPGGGSLPFPTAPTATSHPIYIVTRS